MANFGNTIFAPEGEQFSTYTDKRYWLGQLMVLPDGRKYRFGLAGGSTLAAGKLNQAAANVANHLDLAPAATAVDAQTVTVTLGATAATANQYAEGYLVVDVTPGQGYAYKIISHPAADASATLAVTLHVKTKIKVALTTSSRVSLIKNAYDKAIVFPTTPTGVALGVNNGSITTAEYGWFQRGGMASVLTGGTLTLDGAAVPSTATAGAVMPAAAATSPHVGIVQRVAADTAYSSVFLTLE